MKRFLCLTCVTGVLLGGTPALEAADWPWWRGPNQDGKADPSQEPPIHFSEKENVRWVSDVPGRGHGSPIVAEGRVYLATAEDDVEKQWVLCYDRATGKRVWRTLVHEGGFPEKMNSKASNASSSLAYDGERLFINFFHAGAVYTTALDLEGKQLWQTKITDYVVHQGYGSSPAVYKHLLLVTADNKSGGAVCALDRKTGEIVWRVDRPKLPNYPSPIVVEAAGKEQLILIGCKLVSSLDPLTGKKHWEIPGATEECVTSTVTDGTHVYSSGGWPRNHVAAIKADGSGEIVWENNTRVYVPSMFLRDGHLFGMMDAGVLVCWKSDTGERVWRHRMGSPFTATPVPVGDLVFAPSETGKFYVVKATPEGVEVVAENQLGDQIYATPVIIDSQIFVRVAHYEGEEEQRVEKLYCLEAKK